MSKKILLRDVAGAREFVNRIVNAAEDIAIVVTGRPDDEVRARLQQTRENLKRDLGPMLGAETAAQVADIFVRAVMGEKHEREAIAAMGLP
jgi:hypothetical protein